MLPKVNHFPTAQTRQISHKERCPRSVGPTDRRPRNTAFRMNPSLSTLQTLLENGLLHEAYAHALTTYPEECCGMIRRAGIRTCENIQNLLHREHPLRHPRTSRTAFALDAKDAIFMAESFYTDDPVLAVYHSHPDAGACLSGTDRAGLFDHGEPIYPALFHLVIACRIDHIAEARLFGFEGGQYREAARFAGTKPRAS